MMHGKSRNSRFRVINKQQALRERARSGLVLLSYILSIGLFLAGCSVFCGGEFEPGAMGDGSIGPDEDQSAGGDDAIESPPIGQDKDQPVSSDDAIEPPLIITEQGGEVTGQVTDSEGNPLAEAAVAVPEGTAAVPEMIAITDAAGEYSWFLPAGTFTITLHKDGYVPQSTEVTVQAGETITLDFTLTREQ